jgi:hypothetical protein
MCDKISIKNMLNTCFTEEKDYLNAKLKYTL